MTHDIATTIICLALAFVAYRVLMAYVATLPTSAQFREELATLRAEQERAKVALTNLANETAKSLDQLRNQQTQAVAAQRIAAPGSVMRR